MTPRVATPGIFSHVRFSLPTYENSHTPLLTPLPSTPHPHAFTSLSEADSYFPSLPPTEPTSPTPEPSRPKRPLLKILDMPSRFSYLDSSATITDKTPKGNPGLGIRFCEAAVGTPKAERWFGMKERKGTPYPAFRDEWLEEEEEEVSDEEQDEEEVEEEEEE